MNTTTNVLPKGAGIGAISSIQHYPKRLRGRLPSKSLPFFPSDTGMSRLLKQRLLTLSGPTDFEAVQLVEAARPISLRQFDQIPMHSTNLLHQVQLMAPYVAEKSVVFVGDHDSTSLLLGLLGSRKRVPLPSKMLVVDFDERLLDAIECFAVRHHLTDILKVQLYNVFDPPPDELVGQYDWFYTNPPYGSRNNGESARLFISRGCELARTSGCIILPHDTNRLWTRTAMLATQDFLCRHGWVVDEKINQLHRYWLDDDKELASSVVIVKYDPATNAPESMPYAGHHVDFNAIPYFYGKSVQPPYPRYIKSNGNFEYW